MFTKSVETQGHRFKFFFGGGRGGEGEEFKIYARIWSISWPIQWRKYLRFTQGLDQFLDRSTEEKNQDLRKDLINFLTDPMEKVFKIYARAWLISRPIYWRKNSRFTQGFDKLLDWSTWERIQDLRRGLIIFWTDPMEKEFWHMWQGSFGRHGIRASNPGPKWKSQKSGIFFSKFLGIPGIPGNY